jgi:hypothetical protein
MAEIIDHIQPVDFVGHALNPVIKIRVPRAHLQML